MRGSSARDGDGAAQRIPAQRLELLELHRDVLDGGIDAEQHGSELFTRHFDQLAFSEVKQVDDLFGDDRVVDRVHDPARFFPLPKDRARA